MKQVVLTGIKPTGAPHIGNYFGVMKRAIELSQNTDYDRFYFVADYHALNSLKTADDMKKYFKEIACAWLACGLDPEKVMFYRQSQIPETTELCWILMNVTPKGLMDRAHAYKACVQANEQNGKDADDGINMGLYNYPILMAADILLFNTKFVLTFDALYSPDSRETYSLCSNFLTKMLANTSTPIFFLFFLIFIFY